MNHLTIRETAVKKHSTYLQSEEILRNYDGINESHAEELIILYGQILHFLERKSEWIMK